MLVKQEPDQTQYTHASSDTYQKWGDPRELSATKMKHRIPAITHSMFLPRLDRRASTYGALTNTFNNNNSVTFKSFSL